MKNEFCIRSDEMMMSKGEAPTKPPKTNADVNTGRKNTKRDDRVDVVPFTQIDRPTIHQQNAFCVHLHQQGASVIQYVENSILLNVFKRTTTIYLYVSLPHTLNSSFVDVLVPIKRGRNSFDSTLQ